MAKGILFVISAPSGAGKSTLCQALLKRWPNLRPSISCTTRQPRPNEKEEVDYFFVTKESFMKKVDSGEFIEWAQVHDDYYGTPKAPLEKNQLQGHDIILDIDPQGGMALKKVYPDCVRIFISPPSWSSLEKRLKARAADDEKTITKRLNNAKKEVTYLKHYEYMVINDNLDQAINDLSAIIQAEKHRVVRLSQKMNHLKPTS